MSASTTQYIQSGRPHSKVSHARAHDGHNFCVCTKGRTSKNKVNQQFDKPETSIKDAIKQKEA